MIIFSRRNYDWQLEIGEEGDSKSSGTICGTDKKGGWNPIWKPKAFLEGKNSLSFVYYSNSTLYSLLVQNMESPIINAINAAMRTKCWKIVSRLYQPRMGNHAFCIPNHIAWKMCNWTRKSPICSWSMPKRLVDQWRRIFGAEHEEG